MTAAERIEQLRAQVERARAIAVTLEQENAELRRMLRRRKIRSNALGALR